MSIIYSGLVFSLSTIAILVAGTLSYSAFDGKFDFKIENPTVAILISFTGFFIGISLMLINAFSGVSQGNFVSEIVNVFTYIGIGFVMILLSKFIFDKVVIRSYKVSEELANGNNAVGILDASNFIATGFVVFSTLYWFDMKSDGGIMLTLILYTVSMIMLTMYGVIYNKVSKDSEKDILKGSVVDAVDRGMNRIAFSISIGISFSIIRELVQDNSIILIFSWIALSGFIYLATRLFGNVLSIVIFDKEDKYFKVSKSVIKLAIMFPAPFFFM